MSFDIDWSKVSNAANAALSERWLNDRLNEFCSSEWFPENIGPIQVANFSFGDVTPQIEILDITDPYIALLAPTPDEHDASEPDKDADASAPKAAAKIDEATLLHAVGSKSIQVRARVRYRGNMSATVTSDLRLNNPTPEIMKLPVTASLTGFAFDGTIVAVLDGDVAALAFPSGADRLRTTGAAQPSDDDDGGGDDDGNEETARDSGAAVAADAQGSGQDENAGGRIIITLLPPPDALSPLTRVRLETYIGQRGRQPLRNVDKVERFIVSQLREVLSKQFMYPNRVTLKLADLVKGDAPAATG